MKATLAPEELHSKLHGAHVSTDFTIIVMVTGARVTTMPRLRILVTTWPIGTAPIPLNFVDIMEEQAQVFVGWMSWWQDVHNYIQHGSTGTVTFTGRLYIP